MIPISLKQFNTKNSKRRINTMDKKIIISYKTFNWPSEEFINVIWPSNTLTDDERYLRIEEYLKKNKVLLNKKYTNDNITYLMAAKYAFNDKKLEDILIKHGATEE
jgi:hypothetical protein